MRHSTQSLPFSERDDFKDITPVLQDDGEKPVCPIAYAPEYVDAMNYFRALLDKNELSERALEVTTRVIGLSSANYTAWYFRRLVLKGLQADLREELEFVSEMSRDHPKNYQIWYHRQWIIEQLEDASNELDFTAEILAEDAKNYHSWTHRQWAIKTFNLWEKEIEYVDKLLLADIRNNSAWNQRYFVIFNTTGYTDEVIASETEYTISKILLAPNNESSHNYLLGLYRGRKLSSSARIMEFVADKKDKWTFCAPFLSLQIDICQELNDIEQALELCDKLIGGVDDIHKKYWIYKKSQLETPNGQ
eukprot:TRINITY_DN15297_c0_g1_i1.p1 TRINITY_DN15297_c0_g1~~TRINITY_DN15297_c0_g1_i1.p1  ORF type:complete len:305 (-),score=59.08 TRINITY_DN15297_c0_g1_i1:22-936(-)